MLDSETKRRIDTARDILVGKVPDPKSQVEQITIALVYKFMDDMDKESVSMGGKASFFTGDFERYAWSKIFDPRIGGHEMLGLYGEAIVKLNQNPKVPQLFRDIFKNAYLPYRDPETLKLFLKTINEFTYDHSERLGDAFEYLLSVLGSQGDAGQFRTPRHIIDFMVQVVNPQKNETILDPACGTAGFLISSFKHILKQNTKKDSGDKLTTDERKKLLTNFSGYDISPDMVRLSLVNLYLHGFVQPKIIEYDTLTSEQRWNEYADVILANPPFMSPKGGIKPHKKFSVQSNRSEVLFVDYIAEHLTPTGRAAVIVPEGIIFQSAGAYKQLRKMLVEKHLYAVVSLPGGIFNPYSGVKTSILLMDRQLAKKCDSILFIKIENDGFGLGAQRREQAGSDLPDAVNVISDYVKAARAGKLEGFKTKEKPCGALLVKKEKLAENEEYVLTGERYRPTVKRAKQKWPMVSLGEVCEINPKKSEIRDLPNKMLVSFVPMEDLNENRIGFVPKKVKPLGEVVKSYTYFKDNDVLLARVTPCFENGKAGIARGLVGGIGFGSSEYFVIRPSAEILPEYVYRQITTRDFRTHGINQMTGTGGLQRVTINYLLSYSFPLPPIEIQREIMAEIEGYQKIIDGARQVVESWKPQIDIDPKWIMETIGNLCDLYNGKAFKPSDWEKVESGGLPIIRIQNLNNDKAEYNYFTGKIDNQVIVNNGDLLFSWSGSRGTSFGPYIWKGQKAILNQHIFKVVHKDCVLKEFYYFMLKNAVTEVEENLHGGVGLVHITKGNLERIKIPLPPINIQKQIISKIEAESKVVNGCRDFIKIHEEKIKQVINKLWEK
jgi:type I restriction enzyme M protein